MGNGYVQIAAVGEEDNFFIYDPQITYFKKVWRKNTNFTIEPVPQPFNVPPNFGDKVSCDIARNIGDLLHKVYLVVDLPDIVGDGGGSGGSGSGTLYAWRKYIGYELIDFVEVEVNGKIVDRLYGDWMQAMEQLENDFEFKRLDDMVGNVPELYEFSATKRGRRLHVPLKFWFNGLIGNALPLIALQYSEVKLYVQFKDLSECLLLAPTHAVQTDEYVALYEPFELLHQVLPDSTEIFGRFVAFNTATRSIEYIPMYSRLFEANVPIVGLESVFTMNPTAASVRIPRLMPNLSIKSAFMLCNFVYLDNTQRLLFAKRPHKYLIQQLQAFREFNVVNKVRKFKINFNHPCSTLLLFAKLNNLSTNTTYTTFINDEYQNISTNNLLDSITLTINGKQYLTATSNDIYNVLNKVIYYSNKGRNGVNVIVLDLHPLQKEQPSGSINFSWNAAVELECTFNKVVSADNPVEFTCYALNYNILHIENGIGEVMFKN